MKKRLLLLAVAMLCADAQAQEALPPPKIIEAPQPPEQDQSAQQEQQEQQVLPAPKPVENSVTPQKGQLFAIVKVKEDFYVMVDPNMGRHPCYRDDNKNIFCRW